MGDVGDGEGVPSSAGGSSDNPYLAHQHHQHQHQHQHLVTQPLLT